MDLKKRVTELESMSSRESAESKQQARSLSTVNQKMLSLKMDLTQARTKELEATKSYEMQKDQISKLKTDVVKANEGRISLEDRLIQAEKQVDIFRINAAKDAQQILRSEAIQNETAKENNRLQSELSELKVNFSTSTRELAECRHMLDKSQGNGEEAE